MPRVMLLFAKAGTTMAMQTVSWHHLKRKKKSANKQQQQSLLTAIRPSARWADNEAPSQFQKFASSTE